MSVNRLLEQWRWLCGQSLTLVARNGFGDMFLRTNDGKILWLDVGGGTLAEIAESEVGFDVRWQNRQRVNSGLRKGSWRHLPNVA